MNVKWRIAFSATAICLLIIALTGLFDEIGMRYTDESFGRALATFGVTRGLNAVISVAQGTEIAIEPAGIGVTLTPGQMLDPVNDLIERFSWVILASATALGIQGFLLKIFSSAFFSFLVFLTVLGSLLLIWRRRPVSDALRNSVYRVTVLLLILRFLIPVMAIASEGLYLFFLEPEYIASNTQLAETKETINQINEKSRNESRKPGELSWLERLGQDFKSVLDSIQVEQHMDSLQNAVENLTEHTIKLIVVFIFQTILFPLFFLWMAVKLFKWVLQLQFTNMHPYIDRRT